MANSLSAILGVHREAISVFMIITYNFHRVEGFADNKRKLQNLPVGSFTLTFAKSANYVLARLSEGLGLEIRVARNVTGDKRSFEISTRSSFRFCEKGEHGLFSQDYHQEDPVDKRWTQLFSRLINREKGGRKLLESRLITLKDSHTSN